MVAEGGVGGVSAPRPCCRKGRMQERSVSLANYAGRASAGMSWQAWGGPCQV